MRRGKSGADPRKSVFIRGKPLFSGFCHESRFFIPIAPPNFYNRPKERDFPVTWGTTMTKDEILKKHKQYLFPSIFHLLL